MSVGDQPAALLVEHAAELVTIGGPPGPRRGAAQAELGIVRDGAIAAAAGGRILAVGPTPHVREMISLDQTTHVIDASGRAVLPGFVDPHTHALFAGDRVGEFMRRLQGADYLDILAGGGGILQTVSQTRAATEHALLQHGERVLSAMLRHGTTSVEIKSGYGLSTEAELTMLRIIARLRERTPLTVVATLLAAHAVPEEFAGDSAAYVQHVCSDTIPRVADEGLASYCDVFCERVCSPSKRAGVSWRLESRTGCNQNCTRSRRARSAVPGLARRLVLPASITWSTPLDSEMR